MSSEREQVKPESVRITLPDGCVMDVSRGTTVSELASKIGRGLAKDAVAAIVDGTLVDLSHPLTSDSKVQVVTLQSDEGLDVMRHTTAHVMAQAVLRLFPETKLAIGPTISNGFYYDFDRPGSFTPEDLVEIENEMARIVKEDLLIRREDVSREEAERRFREHNEPYKLELVEGLEGGLVSFYSQGEFVDLCRGPHLPSTGKVGAFKLLNVAGAYWRGDENRPMLSRIYGTAFATRAELDEHLRLLEEAARRDHRKLGRELDLFSIHEEAGAGLIFYHPKGASVRLTIEDFWRREHIARGYEPVITPHIAESTLWTISGHNEYYRENMYFLSIDEREYVLKPMNCPGHILIYKTKTKSYR
ncbi:MAG: TGS domain-containing protein, partial [Firmicutes bacterium]|nr:TGS domain-containing protein [Bacillota bacterium]